jgi:hypothetical protein
MAILLVKGAEVDKLRFRAITKRRAARLAETKAPITRAAGNRLIIAGSCNCEFDYSCDTKARPTFAANHVFAPGASLEVQVVAADQANAGMISLLWSDADRF